MKQINDREVELTEAEQVVHEWYQSLLDAGYGHHEAATQILDRVPIDKTTWRLLNQQDFRDWLTGYKPAEKRHECDTGKDMKYTGTMGAPGVGNCYDCTVCGAPWVSVNQNAWYRADEQDGGDPPFVLTLADCR